MTIRHEFPTSGPVDLDVAIEAGRVRVRTFDLHGDEGNATVAIDGKDGDWDITQVGTSIAVRPRRRWRLSSTQMAIDVPEGSRVTVKVAAADVRLDGRFGDLQVKTASGDVAVGHAESFEVSAASGEVAADVVTGDVRLSTVSGDVRIGSIAGRAAITTASGDVRVEQLDGDLMASTTSGDVRIERFVGAEIGFKTVSGDLDIGLPRGIRVRPDISTISGSTRRPAAAPSPLPEGVERRVVQLGFKSVSGDLVIRLIDAG